MSTSLLPRVSALVLLAALPSAQDSAAVPIGGPGSLSSAGYDDPGLLGDGLTEARARLVFTLDAAAGELELVVENLSPVLEDVPNPVLTRVYFNAPAAVTGMKLLSQSAAAGTSAFELSFDPDRAGGMQPNKAGRLGSFSARLDNGQGIQGAIANALADTLPAQDLVTGPVTFVIGLQGDLSGLESADFAEPRSTNPPGSSSVVAAAKFQGGGEAGASAFISGGDPFCALAATIEDIGGGCGARLLCGPPQLGLGLSARVESSLPGALGVVVISEPIPGSTLINGCEILLDPKSAKAMVFFKTDENGAADVTVAIPEYVNSPDCCGVERLVQVVLFADGRLREATNACRGRVGS